jgi:hypothetical protein
MYCQKGGGVDTWNACKHLTGFTGKSLGNLLEILGGFWKPYYRFNSRLSEAIRNPDKFLRLYLHVLANSIYLSKGCQFPVEISLGGFGLPCDWQRVSDYLQR